MFKPSKEVFPRILLAGLLLVTLVGGALLVRPLWETPPVNLWETLIKKELPKPRESDWIRLEKELTRVLNDRTGHYGLYLESLPSRKAIRLNSDRLYYAASLNKVPLLQATFVSLEAEQLTLQTKVTYLEKDFEEGTGSIRQDDFGTTYSLETILTKLCQESDNVAKNMLFRLVPWENVQKVLKEAEAAQTDLAKNVSTPQEMAAFFKLIYQNKLTSEKSGREMLNLLTNTHFEDRIPEPLPEGLKVAHKIGSWPETGSYHDCGIVFAQNPYVICVMSEGATYSESLETIRQLSRTAFEALK